MNCLFFDLETDGRKIFESACCALAGKPDKVSSATLMSKITEADLVVGHNIKSWDIPILKSLYPDNWPSSEPRIWDTLEMEAILSPLAGCLAVRTAHKATDDAVAARSLFLSQVARFREINLLDTVCGLLHLDPDELPEDEPTGSLPQFTPEARRNSSLYINPTHRTLIVAPRIFWPFLTDIPGLTFHFSASSLDDIVDIDYTPIRNPVVIRDLTCLFVSRFAEECLQRRLQPMVFLMPDHIRHRFRYHTLQYLDLLDLGSQDTNADRRLMCADPVDLTEGLCARYDDIVSLEPEYAALCGARIEEKDCRPPEGIRITRIGDFVSLPGGRFIRKRAFNGYALCAPLRHPGITSDVRYLPVVTEKVKVADLPAGNRWQGLESIIREQRTPLVVAVVHHGSDISFMMQPLSEDDGINFPQGRIRQRRSFHKYIDLATRDASRTGVVVVEDSFLSAATFRYDGNVTVLLCDDDIFGLWRIPGVSCDNDTVDRVTASFIMPVFPSASILRVRPSRADDFVVREPNAAPGAIKESIRNGLLGGSPFRGRQEEYLDAILKGGNHFVCLPTGTGKSVLFQGPAFYAARRLSIVVSPLKALIRDQVDGLLKKGRSDVDYITGDHSGGGILEAVRQGSTRLLYLTPEQMSNPRFVSALLQRADRDGGLGYVVFDEAHCISTWGTAFRPAYLHAALDCMRLLPKERYLFFSATLPECVKDDIRFILGDGVSIHSGSADGRYLNERIDLKCIPVDTGDDERDPYPARYEKVIDILINSGLDWSRSVAAVFFDDKDRGETLTDRLKEAFPDIADRIVSYNADMDDRLQKEDMLRDGLVSVIVCTKAMGMGVDIANIHLIIHVKRPASIEDYIQEVGRAGRGSLPPGMDTVGAYCLDTLDKPSPGNITTWNHVGLVFESICEDNERLPVPGCEFTKVYRSKSRYDKTSLDHGKALFLLKRCGRIDAKFSPPVYLVRALAAPGDGAEMSPEALALLHYIRRENSGGNYEIIPERALDFIGRYTADATTMKYSDILQQLDSCGLVVRIEDMLVSIDGASEPTFRRYRDHTGIPILFKYLAARRDGCPLPMAKGERYFREDADRLYDGLLQEYRNYDLDRVRKGFEAIWTLVTDRYAAVDDVKSAPPQYIRLWNLIAQDSDDYLSDIVIPYRMVTFRPGRDSARFLALVRSRDTYRLRVRDASPLGVAEDGTRLRLEIQNAFGSLKQELCLGLMRRLASDDGFDPRAFVRRYFETRLEESSDAAAALAPFRALLEELEEPLQ